jgi:hypothetical protein
MAFSLLWLPKVLKEAGLKVATIEGWEGRGRGELGPLRGILCHHTAGPKNGNMPSLDVLIHGRPDLNGPLAQLGLGRDGTYYVIAAGRCNHAGAGTWNGITTGNMSFIGIEAEHTGKAIDSWPPVQMDAYQRGVAAILSHAGLAENACAGHKEFAPNRKPDPTFDMAAFRENVRAILAGTAPTPELIPAIEPRVQPSGEPGRPTLRRGASGTLVITLQKKLALHADGIFGPVTEAAVRAFQRARNLVPDGIVGPKTWVALEALPAAFAASIALSLRNGNVTMASAPWPNTLASKMLAAYLNGKFGVSPGELMLRNPPMGALPFFNNSARAEIRRAELGLVAGGVVRFLAELAIPHEEGSNLDAAHADLLLSMLHETAPSSGMSEAVNNHYVFLDEENV